MILGKNDKYMVENLKRKINKQDELIHELKEKIDKLCIQNDEESVGFLIAQIKDYKEREKELLTVLKAIINKFNKQEIIIDRKEMSEAEAYRLTKTNEWLSSGMIYRTISEKCLLDSYKDKN